MVTGIEKLIKGEYELKDEVSRISNFEIEGSRTLKSLKISLIGVKMGFLSVNEIESIKVAVKSISEEFGCRVTYGSRLDYQSFSFHKKEETYPWNWRCVLTVDYLPLEGTLYFLLNVEKREESRLLDLIKKVTTTFYESVKIK